MYLQSLTKGYLQLRTCVRDFLKKAKYNKKKLAVATSTDMDTVTPFMRICLDEKPENFSFISAEEIVEE